MRDIVRQMSAMFPLCALVRQWGFSPMAARQTRRAIEPDLGSLAKLHGMARFDIVEHCNILHDQGHATDVFW